MFILVTAITLWGFLISGSAALNQPIPAHTVTSLLIFLPLSGQGLVLLILWVAAILYVLIRRSTRLAITRITRQTPNPTAKKQANLLEQLGGFANLRTYLILLLLAILVGVGGWLLGITTALLFGGTLAFGLVGNLIEQAPNR